MSEIFVDADGCPVKEEIYRVAKRYGLKVTLVSNSWIRIPPRDSLELVVVSEGPDVADDWIADHAAENDIVVTADVPLASRCLEKGARVLGPRGRLFTQDSIGEALTGRNLQTYLRELGIMSGGPAPFGKRDRSQFLQRLDAIIQAIRREA